MPMVDLGFKDDMGCCIESPKGKKEIRHPMLRIREKVPGFIMDKELRKKFVITAEVWLTEKGKETDKSGVREHAEMEVLRMDIVKKDSGLMAKLSKRKQ